MSLSFDSAAGRGFAFLSQVAQPAPRRLPAIRVDSVIIGGGPAGLAPLIAASQESMLEGILARGVVVVEQAETIGAGRLGGYATSSDSAADTLLSCVADHPNSCLGRLRDHPAALAVAAYGKDAVPLHLVGDFMAAVGAMLHDVVAAAPGCAVLVGHVALQTRQTRRGLWRTQVRRIADGAVLTILSRLVVLAAGGHQPRTELAKVRVAGVDLLARFSGKVLQSNDALKEAGLVDIGGRLAAGKSRRVAVLGSSSSAVACANVLLDPMREPYSRADHVTVLHRRPLRVFYPSAEQALADGYTEFGPDDICPISGFVFRFAGFRLESRNLVLAARGIGGRAANPRLRLHALSADDDPVARRILEEADVIIVALGYRPLALPVLSATGSAVPLHAHGPGKPALVDSQCRVLDRAGAVIPGLLGIGLAAGFIARETSGGEPSFSGQSNGLWQWQNEVGGLIARRLAAESQSDLGAGAEEARAGG